MPDRSEISGRISGLRAQLRKTQKEFAELAGVTQPAVSDWESEQGSSFPSAESYARLGNLASYPENLWFWQRAGMDQDAMLSAGLQLFKERGELAVSKSLAVRPLLNILSADPQDFWYVDARLVPNPATVAYYKLDKPLHGKLNPPRKYGDIILLDTSLDNSTTKAFRSKRVLVEVTEEGRKAEPKLCAPLGLHTGWFFFGQLHHSGKWFLQLSDVERSADDFDEFFGAGLSFGSCFISPSVSLQDAAARAWETVTIFSGCKILGCVIDPSRPIQSEPGLTDEEKKAAEYKEFLAWKARKNPKQ